MQKNSNRKGLALGAIFALFASIFVGVTPAQAAATDGANIAVRPALGTTYGGTLLEDFPVYAQLLPGQTNASFSSRLFWKVEKTAGVNMDVAISVSQALAVTFSATPDVTSFSGTIPAGSTSTTVSHTTDGAGLNYLNFRVSSASGIASWSPVTLRVTAWIDEVTAGSSEGVMDADEWRTTQTITLYHPNSIPATVTVGDLSAGDSVLTTSATITGVNFANLTGKFYFGASASAGVFTAGDTTLSGSSTTGYSAVDGGAALALKNGVSSLSWQITPISSAQTVSVALRYVETGANGSSIYSGYLLSSVVTKTAAAVGVSGLSISAVANANIAGGGVAYDVRPNQTYTIRVHALTASISVSGQAITVALSGQALVTSSKEISVNGGTLTTVYPTALVVTTGADGYATFTLRTSGFADTEDVIVNARVGNNVLADAVTFNTAVADYTVTGDFDYYSTPAGTAVTIPYTIEDQYGEASTRTDQFLKVTRGGTGFAYATTVSYVPVVAGKASVAFEPTPATKTGSATVQVSIVRLDTGAYSADGASTVTTNVVVSAATNAFGTGLAASHAASVSYFPSTVSWTTITGKVVNTGSAVVVTGADLIFRQGAAVPATASGTLTVRAGSGGTYTFEVASLMEGSYTMTLANGAASTTSLLVVDAAAHDSGRNITFDTTAIEAGKTRVITGKVTDMNGNPVATGNTASILVTFAGSAGIPVGAMPTQTNADGEFQVSVLTTAADRGSFTLTASYLKAGATTATTDVITVAQPITVGAAVAAPASDQKLTVGSFKGFVAIYALNYTGQKLSARVAGKWLVVNELTRFQRVVRNTGAGYTIKVDLYIDGVSVRSETVVTK